MAQKKISPTITQYTIDYTDNGKTLIFNSAKATTVVIQTDNKTVTEANIEFLNIGTGVVNFVSGSKAIIHTAYGLRLGPGLGAAATRIDSSTDWSLLGTTK